MRVCWDYNGNRAMVIHTARIGYGKDPEFEVNPPTAPTMEQRLAWATVKPGSLIGEALKEEKVDVDWSKLTRLAGVEDNVLHSKPAVTGSSWRNVIWRSADHGRGRRYKNKL